MRAPVKSFGLLSLLAFGVGLLVWMVFRDAGSEPYAIDPVAWSGWTIVPGRPEDPWILAARPSTQLSSALLAQINGKRSTHVAAPGRMLLPLVLRREYEEGLQGVYSVDAVVRFAREAGIENATFDPVCLAHKRDATGELVFVLLESSVFGQFRQDVIPAFPEHAGTGFYDSGALRPLLVVDDSAGDSGRWWPIAVNEANDCEARVVTK